MKKFLCVIFAVMLAAVAALCGCSMFEATDGRDGQDLNIYDVYEATNAEREKAGLPQIDFLEFISDYLNYNFEYDDSKNLQTVINRSLLSAVGVVSDFSFRGSSPKTYAGSGVIVELDKSAGDAYVLTNAHVVFKKDAYPQTATSVSLYIYGNDILALSPPYIDEVEIVNYAVSYDLALLKVTGSEMIKTSDLRAATFSDEEQVYAGEPVFTVGNPEGMGLSATVGIISKESEYIALDFGSDEGEYYRTIRTDAGVNGGNSGGALYDTSGRIVGIINAKEPGEETESMGYALCGSYVRRLYKLMRDGYKATGSEYGVRRAVLPDDVYGYQSKAYFNNETGLTEIRDDVYIVKNMGGFKTGDAIKHIKIVSSSGETVEDIDVLRIFNIEDALISAREGSKIIYTVSRNGEESQITFTPSFQNYL